MPCANGTADLVPDYLNCLTLRYQLLDGAVMQPTSNHCGPCASLPHEMHLEKKISGLQGRKRLGLAGPVSAS